MTESAQSSSPSSWYWLKSGDGHFDFNMALDEALLEAMPKLNAPVLRFYGWLEPAASFGYFQKYADVEALTPLRPLVRRPTAGGIVPHDADWTYSLAFPTTHEWYGLAAIESYRRVHQWISDAFASLGLNTHLAPESKKTGVGQCFAGFERFDLLWKARKIAGAAQRRRRDGLLIQGSLQPAGILIPRERWEHAMRVVAEPGRHVSWLEWELESWLRSRADELAHIKYAQAGYNQKR